ncbi:MAG: late competence development ComFB family protein [Symploca sp. SIO2G7]|nr:late competence development ComFB family protein [Symploca sp. SIO2G7]
MNNYKTTEEAIALDQFPNRTHVNVMESLVAKEVERQRARLTENLAKYIDPVEVATYALNRLPPLYACNQQGWHHQKLQAQSKFGSQITTAVRQALVAVQRDPLKVSEPLKAEETELKEAQAALQGLRDLLEHREISWHNLVDAVQKALTKKAVDSVRQAISRKALRSVTQEQAEELGESRYDWIDSRYHL